MEIKGKIILALPETSGVSKNGNNWKKREYVLETQETYPKKVHFDFFGDRADQYPLNVGDDEACFEESSQVGQCSALGYRGCQIDLPALF